MQDFDLTQLMRDRVRDDAASVNASIEDALSSLRAAQIIAAIATAAAADFDREPMSVVDSSIANPTDAGSRQELGPPTFLERAHAIAANTCRGIDIDEVATVGATVLLTALQILDDAKWWAKLNPPQQQGLLQVMVCLGSEDQVADARRRAGQGLLALIRLSQAPAAKSRCARQFTAGLREKWNAADYDAGSLNDVERALADWDGEICTAPLHRAVLGHERARHTQSTTPQTTLRLAEALLKCAVDEHRVGNVIAAASFGEEALSLLRDLTSGLDTTEHQLTLAGALRTVAVVLQDGDETQARALELHIQGVDLLRDTFRRAPTSESCIQLATSIDALANHFATIGDPLSINPLQEEKLAILRSFCEHSADANCLESLVFTILRRFWLCVEPVEDQINRNKIDWVAARDLVSDAIAVQHRLCQLNPTLESTEFLAELLSRLAQIEYQLGNAVASAAAIAQYRATKFGNTPQYQWTASQRFHGLLTSAWADLVADAQPEARRKLAEAVAVVHAAGLWGLLYQGLASQSLVDRLGVSAALFGVNPSEGDVAAASSAVLTAMRTRTKGIGNEPFDSSEALRTVQSVFQRLNFRLLDGDALTQCFCDLLVIERAIRRRRSKPGSAPGEIVSTLKVLLAAVAVARSDTDIKVISKLHAAVKRDCTAVRTGDLAVATLRELTHAMCRAVAALHWTSPAIEVLSSHSVTWTRACLARSGDPQDKFELTEAIVNQVQIEMWRDKMTSANLLNDEGLKLARELVALAPTLAHLNALDFALLHKIDMIESRDSDETIEAFLQERILVLQRIVQVSEGEFRQAELDSLMTGWLKDVGRGRLAS